MQGSVRRLAGACLGGWQQSLRRLDLLAAEASGERGRSLHASVSAAALDIVVPSMGDSISEGSIAAILKDAGGSVDEDEPILQVETDKVRAFAFLACDRNSVVLARVEGACRGNAAEPCLFPPLHALRLPDAAEMTDTFPISEIRLPMICVV